MNTILVRLDDGSAVTVNLAGGDELRPLAEDASYWFRQFFGCAVLAGEREGSVILIPASRVVSVEVFQP